MIVEFIGSTGAGKTTLIAAVQRRLAQITDVTTPIDLVTAPFGVRGVTHTTAKNLIQEVAGWPFVVRSLPRHQAFVAYALRLLARQADFSVYTLNNLRSLERKIGVYEILRRYGRDRIVLVDEGTVLTAHNIFVYSSALYSTEEIAKFASLIPLPDVIVYVRAPMYSLVQRALLRPDPPREFKSKNQAQIELYINRAVAMFEQLVSADRIRKRVLIVENPESVDKGPDTAADYITEFVLNYEPVGQ
ncbi:MAG: hypothetical protein R3264_02590 [Anaerolineae bacterium]|nr:hypothetical protein [Anaerolineae bacterium]